MSVHGYGTSAAGCIGAQGHDAKQQLAVSIDCAAAKLNVTAAAVQASQVCNATPGCMAFSVISPTYSGVHNSLLCEIHPETIAQSSQVNQFWSVWQKSAPPKPGVWPYAPGKGPPAPAKPITADLVWKTPSNGVTESMPLANGKLGLNVWADSSDTLWLLVSHVDALDENTNLDKLGRVKIEAALDFPANRMARVPTQAFKQEMHLPNATVSIDLTNGVSIDVWVDATSDAVQVASRGPVHKLQATVEVWRNTTSGYPSGVVNGSVVYKPPLGCASLHPNSEYQPCSD